MFSYRLVTFLNDSTATDAGALFSVCLLGELDVAPDVDEVIIGDVLFVLLENIFEKNSR